MAALLFDIAKGLAARLTTIGHPLAPAAIEATAKDLMDWCKGDFTGGPGHMLTPEEQATALVTEARLRWTEGWPPRGGTAALRALYCELWPPKQQEPKIGRTLEDVIARGLIRPPCPACNDLGTLGERPARTFCTCREGRIESKALGGSLEKLNEPPPKPRHVPNGLTPAALFRQLTEAEMIAALRDEERRKKEQQKREEGLN